MPGQSVALAGRVYTPAAAQVNTTIVDFGIVHRGDAVADRAVSVTNSAPVSAANDTLQASLGTASAGFSAGGTLSGLGAGATDASSLRVGLSTANAGVFAGTATATFSSHDADLADLALGSTTIALRGQVNNFAQASLTKSGAGTLTQVGNTWTLDFGTIALGAGSLATSLGVLNSAIGPADLLSGDFDLGGIGNRFALSGFGSFANLVAGSSFDGLGVSFDTDAAGTLPGDARPACHRQQRERLLRPPRRHRAGPARRRRGHGRGRSGARDLPADGRRPGRGRGSRPAAWATSRRKDEGCGVSGCRRDPSDRPLRPPSPRSGRGPTDSARNAA